MSNNHKPEAQIAPEVGRLLLAQMEFVRPIVPIDAGVVRLQARCIAELAGVMRVEMARMVALVPDRDWIRARFGEFFRAALGADSALLDTYLAMVERALYVLLGPRRPRPCCSPVGPGA